MEGGGHSIITVVVAFIVVAIVISIGIQILGSSVQDCSNLSGSSFGPNSNFNKVIKIIPNSFFNLGTTLDPNTNYFYTANDGNNNISVINTLTYSEVATIDEGSGNYTFDLIYDSFNNKIYSTVTGLSSLQILVINPNSFVIENRINSDFSGGSAAFLAYNPSNSLIFVSNEGNNTVHEINGSTNIIQHTFTGFNVPLGLAFAQNKNYLYVTNTGNGTVSVIDLSNNNIINNISVGNGPFSALYDPNNNDVYIGNDADATISVINTLTNSVIKTIPVGNNPEYLSYNALDKLIYVSNLADDTISVIDGNSNIVINKINLNPGISPQGISYNSNNQKLFVSSNSANGISVIDTNPGSSDNSSWKMACEKANTQTQTAINLLIIILIVIAAAGIISVLRFMRQ